MASESQGEDLFGRVARPLLMTVITTLRPDLHPVASGMAVEQLILELDVLEDEAYWRTVQDILARLLDQNVR